MAKKINITDKLNFDSNPVIVIGDLEVEVKSDAETMLRLMGTFAENSELQAVGEALDLIFSPEDVEKICKMEKDGKKTFGKFFDDYYSVCYGIGHGRRRGRAVTRTMI